MNKKAFTLIELLVVVLIIGILAAIALPKYEVAVEKSRAAEVGIIVKHAKQAFELQRLENSGLPGTAKPQDIMDLGDGTWNSNQSSFCTKYFRYYFSSSTHYDDISVYRCSPKSDCSGCSDTATMHLYLNSDEGEYCIAKTTAALNVCRDLSKTVAYSRGVDIVDQR